MGESDRDDEEDESLKGDAGLLLVRGSSLHMDIPLIANCRPIVRRRRRSK